MYESSGNERVIPIDPALPEADTGAPQPRVIASEAEAAIAYWTGGQQVAVVRFSGTREIAFGGPNDEAIEAHALRGAGLQPYTFSEVIDSPWLAVLERRNRLHPHHDPSAFSSLRHFVLPFHDTIFECIAQSVAASVTDALDTASALADSPS